MAPGILHELAALLLTESILYATTTHGIAWWFLILGEKAALDPFLKEHVKSATFHAANHQGNYDLLYASQQAETAQTQQLYILVLFG